MLIKDRPDTRAAEHDGYTLQLSDTELQRYRLMAQRAVAAEGDAWRRAGITPGARVADIGCGPGAILLELAALVGPDGRVDGVDLSADALAAAEQVFAATGTRNARLSVGDAASTGLEPGAYDVVVMRHVLLHNGPRADAIIQHLATLLRPGGSLYLVESDLAAMRFVPGDPDLNDEFERFVELLRSSGDDVQIGACLAARAAAAGLEVESFTGRYDVLWFADASTPRGGPALAARPALIATGLATPEDGRRWDDARERYYSEPDGKYACVPVFTLTARVPS